VSENARPGLRSAAFRHERESSWKELGKLLEKSEKRDLRHLGAGELARLAVLYRVALSSLSVARSISLDRNVLEHLEALAARAYFVVHGPRRRARDVVKEFFGWRLGAALSAARRHAATAAATLLLGAVTGFVLTTHDPDRFYSFVPTALAAGRDPSATDASLREALYATGDESGGLLLFASYLFSHNAQVGMLVFALGVLAGVPVFLLLFTNGVILGAFAALYASRGMGVELLAWIAPHGVPELFSLVLCGAGGLVLGESLLFPGVHTRPENLRRRGPLAALLVGGAILLDVWAALLEGIFRQVVHETSIRVAVALVNAVLLILYFARPTKRTA